MDPRQPELNKFRAKLDMPLWIITDRDKTPFTDSLRYYCKDRYNFHVEVQYDYGEATIYMTADWGTAVVTGDVGCFDSEQQDDFDKLEESAAKKLFKLMENKIENIY